MNSWGPATPPAPTPAGHHRHPPHPSEQPQGPTHRRNCHEPHRDPRRRRDDLRPLRPLRTHAEVSAIDGVTDVDVDLTSGIVRVTAEQPVPATALSDAVEEAGYTLA